MKNMMKLSTLAALLLCLLAIFSCVGADDTVVYENNGLKLSVPEEYAELLDVNVPQDDEAGILFDVFEKASVEAAAAQGETEKGAGWLFAIGTIDEEALMQMVCYDLSGITPFACDDDDMYYIFYHPTDVRLIRESYENIEDDLKQWSALNEWGWNVLEETFVADNAGLEAVYFGNSELEMYLYRILFQEDTVYTVSTTEFGPLEPVELDSSVFIDQLIDGVVYEYAEQDSEAPDGEYVVLAFPNDNIRFDFFKASEGNNLIRLVVEDDYEILFEATFDDDSVTAYQIMQDWYDALAEDNGKK